MTEAVQPLYDTEKPIIGSFVPAAAGTLKGTVNVSVLATDNVKVSKIELFYESASGTADINGVKYTKIGESTNGTIAFDTTALTDGSKTLLARAVDSSNNVSTKTVSYVVDNTAPPVPSLTAEAVELAVKLTVARGGAASDLADFKIYTSDAENGSYTLLTTMKAGSYTHTAALKAGSWYYATAVDVIGNESAGTAKLMKAPGADISAPVFEAMTPAATDPLRGTVTLFATRLRTMWALQVSALRERLPIPMSGASYPQRI
jgi:hypothetical protein